MSSISNVSVDFAMCTGLMERVKARALHRLLALCVQYVQLQAADSKAIYRQADQPGPRPDSGHYLRGLDEICLAIRSVAITPEGTALTAL